MTSTPALATRAVSGFGTSTVVGAALGIAAWVSDQLVSPYRLIIPANAIGLWLGVAFALGASARTIPTGALRGLVGLLSAVAAYYLLNAILGQGFRAIGAPHAATIWGAVALIAGPIMGGAGAVWRYGHGWPRAIGVAVLAAGLTSEGIAFAGVRLLGLDHPRADAGAVLLAIEVLIGLALPWLLLGPGERLRGYAATIALSAAAAVAIGPVTSILRGLADRF